MKKILILISLAISLTNLMSQTQFKNSILLNDSYKNPNTESSHIRLNKALKNLSLKNYLVSRKEYTETKTETFTPQLSVDVLDNGGIHLFNTPAIASIPSIQVGIKIQAGLIINL